MLFEGARSWKKCSSLALVMGYWASAFCHKHTHQSQFLFLVTKSVVQDDAEFLQCRAARDGLGQAPGEFIELVVHTFPFICWRPISRSRLFMFCFSIGCYLFQQENRRNLARKISEASSLVEMGARPPRALFSAPSRKRVAQASPDRVRKPRPANGWTRAASSNARGRASSPTLVFGLNRLNRVTLFFLSNFAW